MSTATTEVVRRFVRYGAVKALWKSSARQVLLCGPAGTGKSRGALEYVHFRALTNPGMRALLVRKTRRSMTQSTLVTWERKIEPQTDGVTPLRSQEQEYRYPNGSIVAVSGLDDPEKAKSSEWDLIYVNEATELDEHEWEMLDSRCRNGVTALQQLIGDCNPDFPKHWMKQRCDSGRTLLLDSRFADNPTITDAYLDSLRALTGVRYQRLYLGLWAAAEGIVYEGWDRAVHLIDRFDIPPEWQRYWSVDFGYTHPFVWQAWAEDPDGRLYRYRELYMTQRLVEDHARTILNMTAGEPRPREIFCDHDAEGRATLERYLGMPTTPAYKAVTDGIQFVAARLKPAGDGKPRLFLLRDSLVETDQSLVAKKEPTCTEEEFESYVWDLRASRRKGEEPLKERDHGQDAMRYEIATLDRGLATIDELDPETADAIAGFLGR
jgi:hypothetical protein